jgi:2-polyprenyl-3-methyl-5-hydroxy-6-metoxy-1,4-benzoquinol methylase
MVRNDGRLTGVEDWDKSWSGTAITSVRFDPSSPIYRDIDRILRRHVPASAGHRFLEIGAYPGYLMWYFHSRFQHRVSGLEFVPWCCERTRELLAKEGIEADVVDADLFQYDPPHGSRLWDVVASNGFIEHFDDTAPVIERHRRLLADGGLLVLIAPNHSGIYGRLMKLIRPDRYKLHNRMTLADAVAAVRRVGGLSIVYAGYTGRLGFWNCNLYETVRPYGKLPYFLVRAPLWIVEHAAQWLIPNSHALSPAFMVIARRERPVNGD